MSFRKRKTLTLAEKVQVIEANEGCESALCALNQKGERTAFVQKYVLRSESGKMPDSITCHDWLRLQQLFYGHFKLSLFERMAKSAEVSSLLLKCAESLQLSDDALNDLKIYVMRYVYGDVRSILLSTCCVQRSGVVRRRNR